MNSITTNLSLNKKIATVGALGALTVLLGITPLGFIRLPWGLAITLLHIPTILGALIIGWPAGIGIGAIFGIFSLIQAASNPVGLDALFVNPLISVLPRILFGLTVSFIFSLLSKIKILPKTIAASITAVVSTLIHTLYVSFALYGFAGKQVSELLGNTGLSAFILLLLPNATAEAITAGLVTAAVAGILYASKGKKSKLSQEVEQEN
ncbi:MAG: ECF transporter S component [Spirochaetaceae bacterium]|nr:ECF transporter S component [Spirochaetaceae bacterium]